MPFPLPLSSDVGGAGAGVVAGGAVVVVVVVVIVTSWSSTAWAAARMSAARRVGELVGSMEAVHRGPELVERVRRRAGVTGVGRGAHRGHTRVQLGGGAAAHRYRVASARGQQREPHDERHGSDDTPRDGDRDGDRGAHGWVARSSRSSASASGSGTDGPATGAAGVVTVVGAVVVGPSSLPVARSTSTTARTSTSATRTATATRCTRGRAGVRGGADTGAATGAVRAGGGSVAVSDADAPSGSVTAIGTVDGAGGGASSAPRIASASANRSAGSVASARSTVATSAGERSGRCSPSGTCGPDDDGLGDRARAVAGERARARGSLVQHHAERVEVAARGCAEAAQALRRGVRRRPERHAGDRVTGVEERGDAEVADLQRSVVGQQDVAGLHVAVHDAFGVGRTECAQHRVCHLSQPSLVERSVGELVRERATGQPLHHDEDVALGVLTGVVDGDHMRVGHPRRRARLALEPVPERRVAGEVVTQHLHRDVPVEPQVMAGVDGAHPAGAERLVDPVAPGDQLGMVDDHPTDIPDTPTRHA